MTGQAGRPPDSIPLQLIAMHHRAKEQREETTVNQPLNTFLQDIWKDIIIAGHENNPGGVTVHRDGYLISLWSLWHNRLLRVREIPYEN